MAGVAGAPLDAKGKAEADAAAAAAAEKQRQELLAQAAEAGRKAAEAEAKAKADAEAAAKAAADEAAAAEAARKRLESGGAKAALEAAEEARAEALAAREAAKQAQAEAAEQLKLIQERSGELDAYLSKQRDAARVAYLRSVGASSMLTDRDLLTLAPQVDVSTAAGRAQVDAWRAENLSKFETARVQPMPSLAALRERQGDGPVHPGATAELKHRMLAANLRDELGGT